MLKAIFIGFLNVTFAHIAIRDADQVPHQQGILRNKINTLAETFLNVPQISIEGTCHKNTSYAITTYQDLLSHAAELECIFASGWTPKAVPLGYMYGKMISFGNTDHFNTIINNHYQGDFVYESLCKGRKVYLGRVIFDDVTVGVGEMRLGTFPKKALNNSQGDSFGTFNDEVDGLLYEFNNNLLEECGPELQNNDSEPFRNRLLPGWPITHWLTFDQYPTILFTDVLRLVGREYDGGYILLGKTFIRNSLNLNHHPLLIAYYFMLKTYDDDVFPGFVSGQSLPPLTKDFSYKRAGYISTLFHACPFNYLIGNLNNKTSLLFNRLFF